MNMKKLFTIIENTIREDGILNHQEFTTFTKTMSQATGVPLLNAEDETLEQMAIYVKDIIITGQPLSGSSFVEHLLERIVAPNPILEEQYRVCFTQKEQEVEDMLIDLYVLADNLRKLLHIDTHSKTYVKRGNRTL